MRKIHFQANLLESANPWGPSLWVWDRKSQPHNDLKRKLEYYSQASPVRDSNKSNPNDSYVDVKMGDDMYSMTNEDHLVHTASNFPTR